MALKFNSSPIMRAYAKHTRSRVISVNSSLSDHVSKRKGLVVPLITMMNPLSCGGHSSQCVMDSWLRWMDLQLSKWGDGNVPSARDSIDGNWGNV